MLLTILLFCFIFTKEKSIDSPASYTSKTYIYFGNYFETKYNSKIDPLKYSWADSFSNGNLIKRYYPAYQQDFIRTEYYQYDQNSRPIMIIRETKSKHSEYATMDSTIYIYLNDTSHIITKSITDAGLWKEIWTTKGDTTFMEQIINGVSAFIAREYVDNQNRKHRQIIRPELSPVENIFVYNERGHEIQIIRNENSMVQISTTTDYIYDTEGRVIEKTIYWGDREEISIKEITVYE